MDVQLAPDGLPMLPASDLAELAAMRRKAAEAEAEALRLLGEDTSGAVHAKPLSMFNRVSSAALAAKRQTAQYLRLRASRDAPVSSSTETPGSLTPAPQPVAPEPEPMPAAAPAPAPKKKPSRRKPKKAGLLEAVEADVRAARTAPKATRASAAPKQPKLTAPAAREPAKAPEPPKYGYESMLSDVSRAYCGYDEVYFHDRPRELASQVKANQASRAAKDAREVVASREAALRTSKDAARAADAALRQAARRKPTAKPPKQDMWLAAPASPTPAEIDSRIDELRKRAEGDCAPDPVLRRARAALQGEADLSGVRVVRDARVSGDADPLDDPVLLRARAMLSQGPRPPQQIPADLLDDPVLRRARAMLAASQGPAPPPQELPAELLDDPVLRRARAMLAAASAPPPVPVAPSSGDPEELMARLARLMNTEVEPPLTFEPLN